MQRISLAFINDMLDVRRMKQGKRKFQRRDLFVEVVEEVSQAF